MRKDRLPEYRSFPVTLTPHSKRGKRIGTSISVYEERRREIIQYTCLINKEIEREVLLRSQAYFSLERV
jgi:hypothetical protein